MSKGWIRAYSEENSHLNSKNPFSKRHERAMFRKEFKTEFKATTSNDAAVLDILHWGCEVELPNMLSNDHWTKVKYNGDEGFVLTKHLVEIGYVKRVGANKLEAQLTRFDGIKKKLLWGDLVQITKRGSRICEVRVRGINGKMNTSDLSEESLMEVYFIDVAQGDGVLICTPDSKHILIDGGLERSKQQTGKNAADFVDWKFFADYGHFEINLDSMMASHSDNDHYGGLHDIVKKTTIADRELDCIGVTIKEFHHPGLSRWKTDNNANPPHSQGLGSIKEDTFIDLLGSRTHAESSIKTSSNPQLSGPWKYFIKDILDNDSKTTFKRLGVSEEDLRNGKSLPLLWDSSKYKIHVLGPVTRKVDGKTGLPDLGKKSFNTNGHSVCLRMDYGKSRILLTGDLNTKSMEWLEKCYTDRMGAWECDVTKSCHHGSHDVSYRFLEKIKAAATVISSGDAEGHSHPRPEIVGASAMTGYVSVDREKDRLITPLIYMTEIERSVSLGAINRIDFRNVTFDNHKHDGVVLGRNMDELNDNAFMTPEDRKELEDLTSETEKRKFLKKVKENQEPILQSMEQDLIENNIKIDLNITVPNGPVTSRNLSMRAWKARVMEKNHYGLVNVRTDGKLIMCATLDETEHKWVIHSFPARFSFQER